MLAYKFLDHGRVSPFKRVAWPLDAWVADVSACAVEHLPFWLQPELWRCEVQDARPAFGVKLSAARGRLLERVEAWDAAAAAAFAAACAQRVEPEDLRAAVLSCAREAAESPQDAFAAAVEAGYIAAFAAADRRPQERAAQSAWLVERLGL